MAIRGSRLSAPWCLQLEIVEADSLWDERCRCEAAVLAVGQESLELPGDLLIQAHAAAQLYAGGLLPSVIRTPNSNSISPVWRRELPVTGATQLPPRGELVHTSTAPLDARTLVLLVLVQSQDGRKGVAVVHGVQPGDRMQQWHLLVDPSTKQQMTSAAGQASAVHLRFEYTHMQTNRETSPQALYDAYSPIGDSQKGFSSLPPLVYDRAPATAALPTLIRPAQRQSQTNGAIAANYRTRDYQAFVGLEGAQTLRIVPDVPAKHIVIRACKSTGDEPLVFEIAGLAQSVSISECSRVRLVSVQVLEYVNVVASDEIELVMGGEPPRMHLAGVEGCTIKVHKDTWNNEIECVACSGVSVNAVEEGHADTLNLQQASAVERVLLPDSLQTLVQEGRMTTQCHFSHFDLQAAEPALAVDRQNKAPQRSAPPPAPLNTAPALPAAGPSTTQNAGEGGRVGVGLLLKKTEDGALQVARVAEGGAAFKDGRIQAGDLLIAINGISSHGKRLREVGEELSGPPGSEVWLSLQQNIPPRPGFPRPEKHLVLYRSPISMNDQPSSFGPASNLGPQRDLQVPGVQPSSADLDARLHGTRRRIEQALTNVGVGSMELPESQVRVGVGLALRQASDGAYRVSGLVRSGAAEACGQIAVGDVLHSVDGVNLFNSSLDLVKNLVAGPAGSRVVLSFLRPEAQPQDLTKSVNDFDHWRPVVLTRTSNPSGDTTPVAELDEEEAAWPIDRAVRRTAMSATRSASPAPARSSESDLTASRADAIPPHPHRQEEAIGLTLFLEENFEAVAGSESARHAFCADLAADLSACLKTPESRILVVDLLPGSVLADIHILPAAFPGDHRSPERLAAEIAVMVVDPQSALRSVKTTRNAKRTEIRGPISEVQSLRESRTLRGKDLPREFIPARLDHDMVQPRDRAASPPLPPRADGSPLSGRISEMSTYLSQMKQMPQAQPDDQPFYDNVPKSNGTGILPSAPDSVGPLESHQHYGNSSPTNRQGPHHAPDPYSEYPVPPPGCGSWNEQPVMRPVQAPPIIRAVTPTGAPPMEGEEVRRMEQEAMRRILAAAAAHQVDQTDDGALGQWNQSPVDILLRLDLDYSLVGPRNSHQREAFANHLCQDLSNASGLPATYFLIKDMSPGSVLVMTEIRANESNMAISPEAVARDLERQATDPRSKLRSGGITRFTESITLKARLAMSPQPKGMMQRSAPPLSPSSNPPNPPVSPNPNAAPAPPLLPPSPDRQEASLLVATGPKTGVGIVFKRNELGEIEVIGLRPGSSSEQCGAIFVGDKIISIGPVPVTGSSKETVIDLIVGTPGTRVTLGMLRKAGSPGTDNGQSTQVSVTLIRAEAPLAPPSQPVSAAPMTAPNAPSSGSTLPMMDPPGTMTQSQTISKAKEPFEFVGPPRTVALERGMARPGEQAGVGVSFQATKSAGHMVVTKLVPDGPADVCKHFMVGDIILRVNNVTVQSKRIPQVVSLIKGPPGTLVVFTLQSTSLNPNVLASQGGGSLYNSVSSHAGARGLGLESHDSAPPTSAPPSPGIPDSAPEEALLPQGWEKTMLPDGKVLYVNHDQKAFSKVRPQFPERQSRTWQEEKLPQVAAALGIRVVRVRRRSLIPNGKAGIGLGFERNQEGTHFVCGLLPDGSAAQSGQIFVNDKIISVDGRPTQGKTIDEVSEMIQGIEGTDVALTLETTADPQPPVVTQSVGLSDVANARGLVEELTPAQNSSADVYIAGLVISESPFQVLGLDRLTDSKGLSQGQEGYQNETIGTGDAVLAINGKRLKNETSQGLIDILSGPLNSTVEVMIAQGDFMFSAKLARNMLLADYSSWCEYLSCPVSARVQVSPQTDPHVPHHRTYSHATDDAREGAFENMAQEATAQDAQDVPSRPQALPELLPQSGLTLSVRVLQAEGIAAHKDATPPHCVAKLRLIFPDEDSVTSPDHVVATAQGDQPSFGDQLLTYVVAEGKLEETQLELTLWDRAGPDDSFVGEVLLNVNKLQQILGKYFEHSFPLKTSSVYRSDSRDVTGSIVLGLLLESPSSPDSASQQQLHPMAPASFPRPASSTTPLAPSSSADQPAKLSRADSAATGRFKAPPPPSSVPTM